MYMDNILYMDNFACISMYICMHAHMVLLFEFMYACYMHVGSFLMSHLCTTFFVSLG